MPRCAPSGWPADPAGTAAQRPDCVDHVLPAAFPRDAGGVHDAYRARRHRHVSSRMRDVTSLRKVVAEHQATRRKLAAVLGVAIAVVDELRGDNDGRAGDSHIEH